MNTDKLHSVYFIGIGGIGMSALARYFLAQGKKVAGYDRTPTPLTERLQQESIHIHFEDNIDLIEDTFKNKENTLVVYTPAIPVGHQELAFFKNTGFTIKKRAQVLADITNQYKCVAIAGSHGKTSVSGMTAHILNSCMHNTTAFLGGIAKNYQSNLIDAGTQTEWTVAEADEFDRSFLHLNPEVAVITAVDADHLDIYGTKKEVENAFIQFSAKIKTGGTLIYKHGLTLAWALQDKVQARTYALNNESAYYTAKNIHAEKTGYRFDFYVNNDFIHTLSTSIPGITNVENALATVSVAHALGLDFENVADALSLFSGIVRRFDVQYHDEKMLYMDDYAHHPEELKAVIGSVKMMYPNRHITGIFQPHLFSRTRDFAEEFAESLSLLDKLWLMPIYPAREEPIEGVNAEIILNKVSILDKKISTEEQILKDISENEIDIVLTLGAGNIDKLVKLLVKNFENRKKN